MPRASRVAARRNGIRILDTLAVSTRIWRPLATPDQGILREVRAFGHDGRWSGFGWYALQIGSLVLHVLGSAARMLALPLWLWHWRFVRKARQTLTNPVYADSPDPAPQGKPMLETLIAQPQDKILQLIALYRDDPRQTKIDLGVGVYKDATGLTPVMRAVKAAEQKLWQSETTKTYTTLAGDPTFAAALTTMILGAPHADRAAAVATPGGTGAIRQALELIKLSAPGATVWLSNPTWPNHPSIIRYLGMKMAEYRYFDAATRGIDFPGLLADLARVQPGDVVLLHGCCHNPTGANLTMDQWAQVADLLESRKAVPFIDLAYQGFGDGLDADAAPTRLFAARFPEVLIAASCSKNFGIYRERTGLLLVLSDRREITQGNLNFLNRQNYSFPPDHGARLVTMILADPALTADWKAELEEVRLNMLSLRTALADELRRATNSDRYDFVAHHRGMFSRLGLSEAQVLELRDKHAVYMVSDSRINIAGLNARTVPILAAAIAAVGG